jgi:hypothetical protein
MKDLIYYPNFESTNADWLKFSLLYINKLNPIIPITGDKQRSDLYGKLINETDLIQIHRPDYNEGYNSSLDAIDIAERIMNDPYRFDWKLREMNATRLWQDKQRQTYKIYQEKFSYDWESFCLENKFAQKTDGGLLISEQLGNLYMTVLANTIADERGKSPITDKATIDRLSFFLKTKAPTQTKELSNAKSIVEFKLPKNIKNISFDEIIKLRNSKNFKKHLKAFHTELDSFYKGIEDGKTSEDFVNSYNNALTDFSEHILSLSIDTTNFALGAGMLLKSPAYTQTEFFKTIVVAGTGLIVKAGISLNKTWKTTQSKRHCRRYLTQISRMRFDRQGSR